MPKHTHDELVKKAKKKGLTGDKLKTFVFGTLKKIEKKRKGGK